MEPTPLDQVGDYLRVASDLRKLVGPSENEVIMDSGLAVGTFHLGSVYPPVLIRCDSRICFEANLPRMSWPDNSRRTILLPKQANVGLLKSPSFEELVI